MVRLALAACVVLGLVGCTMADEKPDEAVAARVALDRAKGPERAAAFERIRKLATGHHPRAVYELARCYNDGLGVAEDRARAFTYYLEAAKLGDPGGQFEAGVCYADGRGVDPLPAEAKRWLETVAAREDSSRATRFAGQAAYALARRFEHGALGVTKDEAAALQWLRRGVALGEPQAQTRLARTMLESKVMPRDLAGAVALLESACREDGEACVLLGGCYERGEGVRADLERAKALYNKAVDLKEEEGLYQMALLLDREDPKAAIAWYERAALGARWADANRALGRHYRDGLGVPRDLAEAYARTKSGTDQDGPAQVRELAVLRARLSPAERARGEERAKAIGRGEVTDPKLLEATKDVPWPDQSP